MTVKDLKQMLRGVPDDMDVLIPLNADNGFDGMFFSPCPEESGEGEMGIEEETDDHHPVFNPAKTKNSFMLVPCGFFQEHEGPPVELN